MKERAAWPLIVLLALLLCPVVAARCAAQSPPAVETTTTNAPSRARSGPTPTPATNSVTSQRSQVSTSALPSAVSSDIERFVKQSGRDVPPSTLLPAIDAAERRGVRPSPPPAAPTPGASRPAATGPSPLDSGLKLKPAPLGPTDLRYPINLATALRLADARPLIVAAAQAKVWLAEADLTQAKVLWLPQINIGFDFLHVRHDGDARPRLQQRVSSPRPSYTNFFYGGGGLTAYFATTDAIYQPLVARQVLNSRHMDIQSAKNDALLQTADAYFMVHQYRGIFAGVLYTVERGRELVSEINDLSRDLVPAFEVDRARNMLADLQQQAVLARQQWRVKSARLTKVLRLDPRAVVEPAGARPSQRSSP